MVLIAPVEQGLDESRVQKQPFSTHWPVSLWRFGVPYR
jgi:hypothetical protein